LYRIFQTKKYCADVNTLVTTCWIFKRTQKVSADKHTPGTAFLAMQTITYF